jgi:choline dehydrogenase-like flavoprotein
MERFDVLVLGGGAAGRVLASQLSENRDRTVCLVEAGPDHGPAGPPTSSTRGGGLSIPGSRAGLRDRSSRLRDEAALAEVDAGTVVDERCRVLGFENLYVVDASVMRRSRGR